jgi:hypothetical protein
MEALISLLKGKHTTHQKGCHHMKSHTQKFIKSIAEGEPTYLCIGGATNKPQQFFYYPMPEHILHTNIKLM